MRGLDRASIIRIVLCEMDGRVKPGHDEFHYVSISSATSKFGAECVSAPEEA